MKSRRDFLTQLIAIAAIALLTGACVAGSNEITPPNIILIMADDLGYGDLGCYGNREIRTPNIDALAQGGLRFTDYHSNAPVCSPTRAALMTGRYQQRCGIDGVVTAKNHRHTGMALEETTFAEVLGAAGYTTGLFGKWHLGYRPDFNPVKQGFDEFRGYVSGNVDYHSHLDQVGIEDWWAAAEKSPEKGYVTDLITEHGERFIERNKDRPFCLYLAHEAPHYPYQGRNDPPSRAPSQPGPVQGSRTDQTGAYKEMIEAMDEGVGRIVKKVQDLGLEKNTFLFFCSDNGANAVGSNGALEGLKGSLWEGGHRVPAIAYWLGRIEPNTVTSETVMSMDLFPTLLSIAGVSKPKEAEFDGVDLLATLTAGTPLPPRTLFWRYHDRKAVRRGDWKLLFQGADTGLFNLEEDPGEQENLAGSEPERLRELQASLDSWEKEVSAGVEPRT